MSTERAPINVILRGEQSGRQITVMDNVVSAGFPGPPLHHHDFDETFYVLEGELTFQLEDADRLHAGRARALLRPNGCKGGWGRASRRCHGAVARGDHGRSTHRRAPGRAVIRAPADNSPEEVPRRTDRRAF